MVRNLGEVFRVRVKKEINFVIRRGNEVTPFVLKPGEYKFKRIKSPSGIIRVLLIHEQEIYLAEDLFRLYYYPHRGQPGTQIAFLD